LKFGKENLKNTSNKKLYIYVCEREYSISLKAIRLYMNMRPKL